MIPASGAGGPGFDSRIGPRSFMHVLLSVVSGYSTTQILLRTLYVDYYQYMSVAVTGFTNRFCWRKKTRRSNFRIMSAVLVVVYKYWVVFSLVLHSFSFRNE